MVLCRNYRSIYTYWASTRLTSLRFLRSGSSNESADIRIWAVCKVGKHCQQVVTITVEIPKRNLQFLTNLPLIERGQPTLVFAIRQDSPTGWFTTYSAVQIAYGHIVSGSSEGNGCNLLLIEEDDADIHGKGPLVVSGFVPTWQLMKEPTALISVRLMPERFMTGSYMQNLGGKLTFFETRLADKNAVHISTCLPERHQSDSAVSHNHDTAGHDVGESITTAVPILSGSPGDDDDGGEQALTAELAASDGSLTTLSYKISLEGNYKEELSKTTTTVTMKALSPTEAHINIGDLRPLTAHFKLPIQSQRSRLLVARKSSYVEVVAPVAETPAQVDDTTVFPVSLEQTQPPASTLPVCMTVPYIDLMRLPSLILQEKQEQGGWMNVHASLMLSPKERSIRDSSTAQMQALGYYGCDSERVSFKETIMNVFMHLGGVQPKSGRVFAIYCVDPNEPLAPIGGLPGFLIFVSSLKLDMANRTLVADAALLPASAKAKLDPSVDALMKKLDSFPHFYRIPDSSTVMRLWRSVMPAFAERCRTWSHQATCE